MEDQNNKEETSTIEDNLPMVNYIMLHRIYDMLTLIANTIADKEQVQGMVEYHTQGYLLGPAPAYVSGDENE